MSRELSSEEEWAILRALEEARGWIPDTHMTTNGWNLDGPRDRAMVDKAIAILLAPSSLAEPESTSREKLG